MYNVWNKVFYRILFVLLITTYLMSSSCLSPKKVVYFNDVPDTSAAPVIIKNTTRFIDPTIEPNDILYVNIQTTDISTSPSIPGGSSSGSSRSGLSGGAGGTGGTGGSGAGGGTTGGSSTSSQLNGYLVDKNGNIELFLIGFVKVGGLTTSEARELIKQKAREYYKEPVVNVRITNFDITLIGQIGQPGIISAPSEKMSIIDAIAMGGDLPLTAKHKNILLIRSEREGEKKFVRFDFTSAKIFQSPYYYLKQRDIIYVEPTKFQIQNSDNLFQRDLSIFSSIISLISIYLLIKNVH